MDMLDMANDGAIVPTQLSEVQAALIMDKADKELPDADELEKTNPVQQMLIAPLRGQAVAARDAHKSVPQLRRDAMSFPAVQAVKDHIGVEKWLSEYVVGEGEGVKATGLLAIEARSTAIPALRDVADWSTRLGDLCEPRVGTPLGARDVPGNHQRGTRSYVHTHSTCRGG